jgi:ADP-ribose pyrophosphatase YjhB (NUDIX family)
VFHHALGKIAVLVHWLPANEPNKLPQYPFHTVGVGGLVINDKSQLLVVRERYAGPEAPWKLPGGMADPKEELGDVAIREVFEECGIKTEFVSLLGFRHYHAGLFGTSDLYFIARLKPLTEEINFDKGELSDARWMDIDEYLDDKQVSDVNRWIGTLAKAHLEEPEKSEYTAKVLPTWNRRGTNLFYALGADVEAKL